MRMKEWGAREALGFGISCARILRRIGLQKNNKIVKNAFLYVGSFGADSTYLKSKKTNHAKSVSLARLVLKKIQNDYA